MTLKMVLEAFNILLHSSSLLSLGKLLLWTTWSFIKKSRKSYKIYDL